MSWRGLVAHLSETETPSQRATRGHGRGTRRPLPTLKGPSNRYIPPETSIEAPEALASLSAPQTPTAVEPSAPSCPDCGNLGAYNGRWCLNCGRELDGRPSSVADRAARHIRKLERLGLPTKGHGPGCITRTTGGWTAPEDERANHTLRQDCPCCGRSEFHGAHCSGCGIPTGAADWHPPIRTEAQQENAAKQGAALWEARQNLAGVGENAPSRRGKPEDVTLPIWPVIAAQTAPSIGGTPL